MPKDKSKAVIPNRHLHARVSYLQQAATYITTQAAPSLEVSERACGAPIVRRSTRDPSVSGDMGTAFVDKTERAPEHPSMHNLQPQPALNEPYSGGLPNLLSTHLTQVARKSQIRLHPNIKHSICKRCRMVLISGATCRKFVENLSNGGRKPHADVLVIECGICGAQKRWPIAARRQRKKGERKDDSIELESGAPTQADDPTDGATS